MTRDEDTGHNVQITRCPCGQVHHRSEYTHSNRAIDRGGQVHLVFRCPNGREVDFQWVSDECGGGGYSEYEPIEVPPEP